MQRHPIFRAVRSRFARRFCGCFCTCTWVRAHAQCYQLGTCSSGKQTQSARRADGARRCAPEQRQKHSKRDLCRRCRVPPKRGLCRSCRKGSKYERSPYHQLAGCRPERPAVPLPLLPGPTTDRRLHLHAHAISCWKQVNSTTLRNSTAAVALQLRVACASAG